MATFTSTSYLKQARIVDNGVGVLFFRWNSGLQVFGSVGDTVLLGRLPRKSTCLNMRIKVDPGSNSSGSTLAGLFYFTHSGTSTTTLRANASYSSGMTAFDLTSVWDWPRISFTGTDAVASFADVKFRVVGGGSGSITTSVCVVGYVQYICQPE